MRFSIVVPVFNNSTGIKNCIESLLAIDYPRDDFEILVVDNNSNDSTAEVVKASGVTCLRETRTQSLFAARNTGIQAAKGEFVAFTDADCVADRNWLKVIDAASGDEAAGCLAGEVLSVTPTTTVERFSDKIGLLRQKGPLSGWHFKPYAQTANAVYRRAVFDRIGLFDTAAAGSDALFAWQMLEKTGFKLRFVPDAIVYHHHRTNVPDLYLQFRQSGETEATWARLRADYKPPSVPEAEQDLVALFKAHVDALEAAGVDDTLLFSALDLCAQTARFSALRQGGTQSGKVEPLLATRDTTPTCGICGSTTFVPGPGGRLCNGKPPQCAGCGSLERHRVAFDILAAQPEVRSKSGLLCVGEALPAAASKGLGPVQRVNMKDLPRIGGQFDAVLAMSVFEASATTDPAITLESLLPPLHEKSVLVIYEPARRMSSIGLDALIPELLPETRVTSEEVKDSVTGDQVMVLVVRAADASTASTRTEYANA